MNLKNSSQKLASHQWAMCSMNLASGSEARTPSWLALMISAERGQRLRLRVSGFFFVPFPGYSPQMP